MSADPTALNLNPGLADLLALNPDPVFLVPMTLVTAAYLWRFLAARRSAQGRARWPAWRAALFLLGMLILFLATQSKAVTMTLNSMALYMGRLMIVAELVPPLLILGIPRGVLIKSRSAPGQLLSVLLDPWVALAMWTAVVIFWNVPAGLNASVVTNTATALLPALYLLSSLLVWGVILRPLPTVQAAGIGSRGWFGLLASLPMMSVAAVWLYARVVLYTPYVSALCLWNLSPLQNQQLSGWIMMMAGLPGITIALIQVFQWLLLLTEGSSTPPPTSKPS